MYLLSKVDKPFFKVAVLCFIIIFWALGVAYMSAGPPTKRPVYYTPLALSREETLLDVALDAAAMNGVGSGPNLDPRESVESVSDSVAASVSDDGQGEIEEIVLEPRVYDSPWTYSCENSMCQRKLYVETDFEKTKIPKTSQNVCWLTCGQYGSLWPIPATSDTLEGKRVIPFQLANLHFSFAEGQSEELRQTVTKTVDAILSVFRQVGSRGLNKKLEENGPKNTVNVIMKSKSSDLTFTLGSTEEDYKLLISISNEEMVENGEVVNVSIEASTYFGIRHALETLSQLVAYDDINSQYQIVASVNIEDSPAYKYRGVLIDVARNFIPVTKLESIVDGMAYNKMNILHVHFADLEAFSFFHPKFPEMSICGSYSKEKKYALQELREFVNYARIRGVKVVPEFDPNHLRFPEDFFTSEASECFTRGENKGYFVNLFHPSILTSIGEFYKTLFDVFDNDVLHFGSFDVSFDTKCLQSKNQSEFMSEWMKNENITDFSLLRPLFLKKVFEKIQELSDGKPDQAIVFDSEFSKSKWQPFSHSYVMQSWDNVDSVHVKNLVTGNYSVVISNAKYSTLNSGFNGPNHEYTLWQNLYDSNFQLKNSAAQALGSEILIWTQNTNAGSIEAKLWPRGSALAERLWSNPTSREKNTFARMNNHNIRMLDRGIKTESLQPESCYLINGSCGDIGYRRIK